MLFARSARTISDFEGPKTNVDTRHQTVVWRSTCPWGSPSSHRCVGRPQPDLHLDPYASFIRRSLLNLPLALSSQSVSLFSQDLCS